MAPTAVELLKRAFSAFEPIAKRDPRVPGAVEVDLGKVAVEFAKAASTFGGSGDVDSLEKAVDDIGSLLEKSTYDATTDRVYSAATDLAKRVAVNKAESAPQYTHEGGNPTPPAKGSKEQKANQYTAEGGLANETGPQYLDSSAATVATTPSGAPAIGFDQPAGGPVKKAATPPAKPTRTAEGVATAEGEAGAESPISEGKQGRRAATGKRARTAKSAHVTTEELWARDMAEMTQQEVSEVRKAAKAQAMGPEAEVDKAHDAGSAEGSEVDEVKSKAKKAAKPPEAAVDDTDDEGDDDSEDGEVPAEATDDRSSADAKRKAAKKAAAAKKGKGNPFADKGKDDEDETEKGGKPFGNDAEDAEDEEDGGSDEEAEGEEPEPKKKGKTAKASEDEGEWPADLAPANSPVEKAQRLPVGHIGARAGGAKVVAKRHAEIRKAALEVRELEVEEVPGDELTPDQVAELKKRAKLTPAQQRRANAKRLKEKGYTAGSRELEVEGIDDAVVANEE